MSGFFVFRRDGVDADELRPVGFKILLEIVVKAPQLQVAEVPYEFAERYAGSSKASTREGLAYARHLSRLRLARPRVGVRHYDIHGIIGVESEGKLPELEPFRVNELGRAPDVKVRIGPLPAEEPVASDRFRATFATGSAPGTSASQPTSLSAIGSRSSPPRSSGTHHMFCTRISWSRFSAGSSRDAATRSPTERASCAGTMPS